MLSFHGIAEGDQLILIYLELCGFKIECHIFQKPSFLGKLG
jgi:hypothetical protein